MAQIRENTSFFILRSIRSIYTSSRANGEVFLAKKYSTQIFQYTVLVAKGLINVEKVRVVKLNQVLILYKYRKVFSIPENR